MKEYRVKLKHGFTEALVQIINDVMERTYCDVNDTEIKIYIAALEEVKIKLAKKLIVHRPAYLNTFSPVQALALRMLYADYCLFEPEQNTYAKNKLRMISDEVFKHYL